MNRAPAPPRISVVIATFQRPEMAVAAVKSVLASEHDAFELILVDQNAQATLPRDFVVDGRLRVLRSRPEGASVARNRGTKAAQAALVAYTDDDCEVDPRWLCAIEDAFRSHPNVGLVLGSVLAGPHDRTKGFIPACTRSGERLHERLADCPELEVMGASMAMRMSVWERLGGFWEALGPGQVVRAAEDYDVAVRALLAEIGVLEWPPAIVRHHGFRTWEQGRKLIHGYTFGTAYVLGYRLGGQPVDLARCLVRFWLSFQRKRSVIVRSAGPVRGSRILSFGKGLAAGMGARWRSNRNG
jgi:GT2 family glycosyltransferase